MKKIIIFSVAVLLSFSCLYAEEGQLSFEESHKDKESIFLENTLILKLNPDWSYRQEEYKKIKIQKEEARYMGEIPIPYEKGKDKIVEISAYTITSDGKRHRYTKIQDVSEYEPYPVYSDSMVKIITMPEVNVGSVIEFKVVTESKGKPIKNSFWEDIYLLTASPVKSLKRTIILPKKLNIQYKEFNLTQKPKISEDKSDVIYSWQVHDVYDERKSEDYVPPPSIDDVIDCVEFSSIKSWSDISDWYYGLIQNNIRITPEIKQVVLKAIEGKTTLKDKVRAILEYIQDNFRYVSMSFGPNSLEPHPTDEVFNNKYGDCKDLSLLCMAMLKVAGIKSNIALFQDEYSITDPQFDLPSPDFFDHVLLLVEDENKGSFYIDPLLKGYDIGEYPLYYQNAYTFIITADGGRFGRLAIFPEQRNSRKDEINKTIYPDGSVLMEASLVLDLDDSIQIRQTLKGMNDRQKEDLFQYIDALFARGGEVIERRIDNLDARYGRLNTYIKARQRDAYLVSDGLIVIEIAGYQREIEFTKEKRENPIFFPDNTYSQTITTYHIPEGFRLLSLPENIDKDIGIFSVRRQYRHDKDKIIIYEIKRQRRLKIPKEEYESVKEFFDKLPRDTYQRIIFKKTKPLYQGIKEILERLAKRFKK